MQHRDEAIFFCVKSPAQDGDDALRELLSRKGTSKNYDFFICDQDLPRLSGSQLIGLMHDDAEFSRIPVVVVSGRPRARGTVAPSAWHPKPDSYAELIDLCQNLCGEFLKSEGVGAVKCSLPTRSHSA